MFSTSLPHPKPSLRLKPMAARKSMAFFAGACGLFLWLSSAFAQDNAALKARLEESLTSTPGFEFPSDRKELDAALDSNNYAALAAREKALKSEKDVFLWMNWLKYRC